MLSSLLIGEVHMDTIMLLDTLLTAGTVMLVILWILYQRHTFTWVRQHGRPVTALVTCVTSAKLRVPGRRAFVTAQWTDPRTGRDYTFEGLSAAFSLREGALVTVWIDPQHPQHYLMDR